MSRAPWGLPHPKFPSLTGLSTSHILTALLVWLHRPSFISYEWFLVSSLPNKFVSFSETQLTWFCFRAYGFSFTPFIFIAHLVCDKTLQELKSDALRYFCFLAVSFLIDKKKSPDQKPLSVSKGSVIASTAQFAMQVLNPSLGALFLIDRSVDRLVDIDFLIKKRKNKVGYGTLVYR